MPADSFSSARTEQALAESLKEIADIKFALDQSTIVAITDQRGIINYVNDEFCRISKYSREELLGQDHRIINSGYHPKDFIRNLWTTIASGKVWKGELRNRAKDGSTYWVDTTIVPFLDADGKPYQYVAIRHDITRLKEAEEQIRQQTVELQRAAQLSFIGELAAGLAHEVKNPLAGIQGAVDILIRRRDSTDPELEVLTGIRQQVERIDGTVRAMLDRARPRSLHRERTSLTELTQRAVNVARAQLIRASGKKKTRIEFEPPEEDIELSIDAALMEDAILNLAINAIEAMDEGGTVSVKVRRAESKDHEHHEQAVIEVADTGGGIKKEDLQRIFNPFFTTTAGGTGLGLPAVRRIVRIHGGSIDVDSTVGKGSRFRIRLPLADQ
jgi:PAS domain S-box-containing protein